MSRPITLFTGQWADLPLSELAAKCADWGFDGLELACWGDHFDVAQAVRDPGYAAGQRKLLEQHGLGVWAIGNHLVGQAVCDPIDERHRGVLPPDVWGDGDPEGVRRRAAAHPRGARAGRLGDRQPPRRPGGLRSHRRAAPGDPPPRRLGRRRPGRGKEARRRQDEGYRAGRGPLWGHAS